MQRKPDVVWFADLTRRSLLCQWFRPESGFRWVDDYERLDGQKDAGPWLVPEGNLVRRYGPLAKPQLYKAFTTIDDPDTALRFANEYGQLTPGTLIHAKTLGEGIIGESFQLWKKEARWMRFLIQLWGWARTRDQRRLMPYIWWEREPRRVIMRFVFMDGHLDERTSARARTHLRRGESVVIASTDPAFTPQQPIQKIWEGADLDRWPEGDLIEPAWWYLCEEVNKKLKRSVSPRVLPLRRQELSFQVDSLLAVLYLQLQLDMVESHEVRSKTCRAPGCANLTEGQHHYCHGLPIGTTPGNEASQLPQE